MAAKRLASELGAFLGEEPPVLPSRELTLAGAIGVSRQWEQQRLRLLYALAQGRVPVLVASLDALLLRTLPRQTLFSASVTLRVGAEYSMPELIERLTRAGYSRASLVEGVGQFALRGGILDVYSPAQEKPLRAEFFGDELDTMGYFDPITQRRTENVDEAVLLPVAETEPHLHPQGISGLCEDLRAIIARQQRRKTPNQALIETLQKDCEALENETLFRQRRPVYGADLPGIHDRRLVSAAGGRCRLLRPRQSPARGKGSCGGVRPPARFVFDLRHALWRAVRLLRDNGRSGRVTARPGCYLLRQLPCRAVPGVPAAQAAAFLHGPAAAGLWRKSGNSGG